MCGRSPGDLARGEVSDEVRGKTRVIVPRKAWTPLDRYRGRTFRPRGRTGSSRRRQPGKTWDQKKTNRAEESPQRAVTERCQSDQAGGVFHALLDAVARHAAIVVPSPDAHVVGER